MVDSDINSISFGKKGSENKKFLSVAGELCNSKGVGVCGYVTIILVDDLNKVIDKFEKLSVFGNFVASFYISNRKCALYQRKNLTYVVKVYRDGKTENSVCKTCGGFGLLIRENYDD